MQPADVVADRFELIRLAGAGGMGQVWQAHDRVSAEPVALKLLASVSENTRASFAREALTLAELRHPGIVRYVAHGVTPAHEPYLVMEWLEGEDLARRLARGPLGVEQTLTLLGRVADALALAHGRDVIHRDLKPSNLYLPDGAVERVKILDFGIARRAEALLRTHAHEGALIGTPGYMAPEQARGEEDIDGRADVFALACVAFECLTGRRAFEAEHPMAVLAKILLEDVPRVAQLVPEIPAPLDLLVQRMLSKERAERPSDARELAAALAACAASDARGAASAPALTRSEQRFVGVVVAPAFERNGPLALDSAMSAPVRAAADERGAQLEQLADGSLLAVLARSGAASDLATQAARCALAMHRLLPDRPLALTLARGEVGARLAADAIDRAARLLLDADGTPRATATGVALDEATAALLDARFELVRDAGNIELRRELLQEDDARTLLGKVTECVGREREVAALAAICAQCAEESVARAVLMTAPAGMGKSRLRNELVTRLRARASGDLGHQVWIGRADPMRSGSAFGLAAQLLRQACGISEGEPAAQQQERLRARVARHALADPERVTEFLGELIGAPFDDRHSPQLRAARQDAMLLGDQLRRAFEDFVRAESEGRPLLVILEDLHWGDLATVKLVDALLRNLRQRPITVLASARPEVHDRFPNLWAEREAQEMRLSGLTRKSCTRIVRNALGESASEEVVQQLIARAEGNAFYLEELIRTVAEGKGAALPDTIVATVQARLERLDPAARLILRAASIFGQTFWKGAASELLAGAPGIDDWLAQLTDAEVISQQASARFASEDEYTFRHALLREGAYALLTPDDRALGHRLAGDWLDRQGERDAMVLAEHFELGGSRERAVAFYPRAAEQALEGNDLEGVLARSARGIACGAAGPQLGALRAIAAEAHNWRGENAEGELLALEAMALLPAGSEAWYAAAREGIITAMKLGNDARVAEIVETARSLPSDEAAINARRMALGWGAMSLLFGGSFTGAEAILDDLDLAARAPTHPDARVEAVVTKARAVRAVLQRRAGAFELLQAALAGFVEAGDLRNASATRVDLGVVCMEFGDYAEAEPMFRGALAEAEQMNLYTTIAQVKLNLGCALAGLGRLEEASAVLADAAAALAAQGDRRAHGAAECNRALVLLRMGDVDDAERLARAVIEQLQGTPDHAFALAALGNALLRQERPLEALAAAEEAVTQLRALGSVEEGESLVRLVYAEALDQLGDPRARDAAAEARTALLARADAITDPAQRTRFLEGIDENARTLAFANRSSEAP